MIDFITIAPYLNALIFLLTLPVIYYSHAFTKLSKKLGCGLVVFFIYSSIMRLVIMLSSFKVIDQYYGKEIVPSIYFPFWIGLVIIFYIMAKSLRGMPNAKQHEHIKKLESDLEEANELVRKAKETLNKERNGAWIKK
jgi:hypothetical protein